MTTTSCRELNRSVSFFSILRFFLLFFLSFFFFLENWRQTRTFPSRMLLMPRWRCKLFHTCHAYIFTFAVNENQPVAVFTNNNAIKHYFESDISAGWVSKRKPSFEESSSLAEFISSRSNLPFSVFCKTKLYSEIYFSEEFGKFYLLANASHNIFGDPCVKGWLVFLKKEAHTHTHKRDISIHLNSFYSREFL